MNTKPDLCVSSSANNLSDPVITSYLIFIYILKYEVIWLYKHIFNPPYKDFATLRLFLVFLLALIALVIL